MRGWAGCVLPLAPPVALNNALAPERANPQTSHVTSPASNSLFRLLPSVDELLRSPQLEPLLARYGQPSVTGAARALLEQTRRAIADDRLDEPGTKAAIVALPALIENRLSEEFRCSLRPVINATGVILHTNLGRAPLSRNALEQVAAVAQGYSNLEFDLETGERGERDAHTDRLFARLLNTPEREVATIVVNNNAAAVLLSLNALAEGGEVIVSRGELVEIGGSFRIPDVMSKSGAVLREVGTTNRTRISDYEAAITDRTKLLLRVHRSNFQIVGFTEQPSLEELVTLGHKRGIPVMEDLGSGDLFDLRNVGVHNEPTLHASVRAGVDVITYSGDKLLGGPQAGLISGTPLLVRKIRSNPLFRAVRVDKMFYAALETTLLAYLREDYDSIPTLRMMRLTEEEIADRAEHLRRRLHVGNPQLHVEVQASQSVIGGGSAPGSTLPARVVAVSSSAVKADALAEHLRHWEPPIIARVEEGRVLLDLRAVEPGQEDVLVDALTALGPPAD